MAAIDTFLTEVSAAIKFEDARSIGYQELLAFPLDILSSAARVEVQEALDWSTWRLKYLVAVETAIQELRKTDYPNREPRIASKEVIEDLNKALIDMTAAISEFSIAIEGNIEVGPEVAIQPDPLVPSPARTTL